MKLYNIAIAACVAVTVSADRIEVNSNCDNIFGCKRDALWYNDWNNWFGLDGGNGCRGGGDVPYLDSVCFDWNAKRGHFYFRDQPKRCFRQVSNYGWYCGASTCYTTWFHESPCEWREAPGSTLEISATANSTIATANSTIATAPVASISATKVAGTTPVAKASAFTA